MCGTSASDMSASAAMRTRRRSSNRTSLDREIQPQELQLPPQRHLLRLHVIEREAQQVAEPGDHGLGLGVFCCRIEHDDRAERVEEEVRLQLHLQRAQLRRRQLLRQLGRLHLQLECLPFTGLGVLLRSVHGLERDDRPIPDGAALKAERQHDLDGLRQRRAAATPRERRPATSAAAPRCAVATIEKTTLKHRWRPA